MDVTKIFNQVKTEFLRDPKRSGRNLLRGAKFNINLNEPKFQFVF